ncbi:organic hydroperoxide resistance protein [Bacillus shivajii]|uniref:organic hydroperoxide resistance protein n=1 Tax=Bacillus shivajii TaxID=1983719 RepID=UPI001CFC09C5|nr:organic hydroperoxide resistance protein [Bacillus shivajii]UCZ55146.1 organic hydroperoxide resistance protein [Bacillus shivajii]
MNNKVFSTKVIAKGGREGSVKSDNGVIDLELAMPKGDDIPEDKTNPEQLFAGGYAACFDGALNLKASEAKKEIESSVEAEVGLLNDNDDCGFKLGVILNVHISGVSQDVAEHLVKEAHEFCPYSKATRGNIDVELNVHT